MLDLFLKDALLFVERKQISQKEHFCLFLATVFFQVENAKFLTIPVAVKVAVGVIENYRLAVFRGKRVVACCA